MYLREAAAEDIDLIFRWVNDDEVRRNSFSIKKITAEEHSAWYRNVLNRNDVRLYILVHNDNNIGQIRINIDGDSAEISYSVAPEYRNMGYGKKMILLLNEKVKNELPQVRRLTARTKPGNAASRKVFISMGYVETAPCSYVLDISKNSIDKEK